MAAPTVTGIALNHNDPMYANLNTKVFPMALSDIQFDSNFLLSATPFIQGHGMVLPISMPKIFRETPLDAAWTFFIQKILTNFVKGIDGISNWSVEADEMNLGGDANMMQVPTKVSGAIKDFTLTLHSDLSSAPISRYFCEYARRIYDPHKNRAYHYPGATLRYSNANHCFEFLVINCDPTMKRALNYSYLQNCIPTEGKRDMWNFTRGDTSTSELQLPFTCREAPYSETVHVAVQALLTSINVAMNTTSTKDATKTTGEISTLDKVKSNPTTYSAGDDTSLEQTSITES